METKKYERPDSQQLLRRIQLEEEEKLKKTKGKLKIFLGYAAGSGKTYAMLTAAHEAKKHKIDVVAGYIEPHDRPDTQALVEGLETIAPMEVVYKGVKLREFNLDAALKRNPRLILVDELAHTNVKGCRNEKRYQDVKELLRAGIDVYTTMNVQHLESLNDIVGSITHINVRERVPDKVFDHADQVEVIDIEPEELIERMKEGKIYAPSQAERALGNFFRREKLVALREITLRRTADRVNHIAEEERYAMGEMDYHTGEHVLVCISPSPSNTKVIRTAARLAYAFHAQFTGIYVETSQMQDADEKTKSAVKEHMDLARALGADVVTVYGNDIVDQVVEYAIVGNISKIVMGRSRKQWIFRRGRLEVLEQLTYRAPNIDVYIIPDMENTGYFREGKKNREKEAVANMRKEFSANVSHELKTPLTSISGYAEIMKNGLVRPEDISGFSERIYKEARRLITLIEDIIKLSKLDEESVELEKEDVDLYELTREIVSRLSPQAAQKNIRIELSGESVHYHGIRQILDEMVYNVCENAVKYNYENGKVSVWAGNTLNGPKISVSDTGIGIPKEHQERIFERFYRVDKSHSKERGGTGLGLSIVKHGALLHGAKVSVESEEGRGTKISMQFPRICQK